MRVINGRLELTRWQKIKRGWRRFWEGVGYALATILVLGCLAFLATLGAAVMLGVGLAMLALGLARIVVGSRSSR